MNSLLQYLRQGPVMVGEVRGFKSEIGKKFDKSDKNAPPITFGVFKINVELLCDGTPVIVSIYPDQSQNVDGIADRLKLKRGGIAAFRVGKTELKNGQRMAVCPLDGVHVLTEAESAELLRA
jgi:hypothetical protein